MTSNHPVVSVIIPIFNTEKYIEKCVRSLMEQTLEDGDIEYIFVNDCTPDNSIAILKGTLSDYPSRINQVKVIKHNVNKGIASARATGIKHAKGDYIIHCDSDDWVDKDCLRLMYDYAIEYNADVVSCDFYKQYGENHSYCKGVVWGNEKINNIKLYMKYPLNTMWMLLIKNSVYQSMCDADQDAIYRTANLGITYCDDFHLSVRLLANATTMVRVPHALYYYNQQNTGSLLHNLSVKSMHDEQKTYLDIIDFFKERGEYEFYKRELGWRILKSKQELILNRDHHKEFILICPDSHKFIWSCPYINIKLKIMMWGITHNFSIITNILLFLRNLKNQ